MSSNPRIPANPDVLEIYPVEFDFKGLRTRIIKLVNKKKLCRGTLTTDYVNYALRKSQYVIGYEDGDKLKGFAALKFMDKETLRVYLLCSAKGKKGMGRILNDAIEEFAAAAGVKKIVLKSVDVSKGFYTKVGYVDNANTGMPNSEPEEELEEHQKTFPMSKTFKVGGRLGRRQTRKWRR